MLFWPSRQDCLVTYMNHFKVIRINRWRPPDKEEYMFKFFSKNMFKAAKTAGCWIRWYDHPSFLPGEGGDASDFFWTSFSLRNAASEVWLAGGCANSFWPLDYGKRDPCIGCDFFGEFRLACAGLTLTLFFSSATNSRSSAWYSASRRMSTKFRQSENLIFLQGSPNLPTLATP